MTQEQSSERGARIVQTALALMKAGKVRGWSAAIEEARKTVNNEARASQGKE